MTRSNRQPTERQWLCCCLSDKCKGEGPWRTIDGDLEFFIGADDPVRCPECGSENVWVYPY